MFIVIWFDLSYAQMVGTSPTTGTLRLAVSPMLVSDKLLKQPGTQLVLVRVAVCNTTRQVYDNFVIDVFEAVRLRIHLVIHSLYDQFHIIADIDDEAPIWSV